MNRKLIFSEECKKKQRQQSQYDQLVAYLYRNLKLKFYQFNKRINDTYILPPQYAIDFRSEIIKFNNRNVSRNIYNQNIIFIMLFKIAFKKEIHLLNKQVTYKQLNEFIAKTFKKLPKNYSITYIDEEGDQISVDSEDDIKILYQSCKLKTLKLMIQVRQEADFVRRNSDSDDELAQIIQNFNQRSIKLLEKSNLAESILFKSEIKQTNKEQIPKIIAKQIQLPSIKLETNPTQNSNEILHPVSCTGCHKNPIAGIRFYCPICENIDYCSNCENIKFHAHPLLKINYPQQSELIVKVNSKFEKVKQQFSVSSIETKKIEEITKDKIQKKQQVIKPKEQITNEEQILINAQELANLFGIYFNYALKIAQANPHLSKEQIVAQYISMNSQLSGEKNRQYRYRN